MKSSNSNPDTTESSDILMPSGIMNIMVDYEDKDAEKITSGGSLVSTLFNSVKTRKLKELRALLIAIVDGKPEEAKALLDKDPSLVLEKLEEKDFVTSLSEHKFNLQPYQAALAVEDTQMANLVRSYFKDEKEADRQRDEQQNPNREMVEAEQEKWQAIFTQLNKITWAIRDSKAEDITSLGTPDYIVIVKRGCNVETELHTFWRLLDATKDKVITAGKKPFNPRLFLAAWQTYENNNLYQEYFGGFWNDPRALLFWQKVMGYDGIQRIMPVNYVQALLGWSEDTIKKLKGGKPQARETLVRIDHFSNSGVSVNFYPLQLRGTSSFNFAIHCAAGRLGCVGVVRRGSVAFEEYVNQKQQPNRTYAATPNNNPEGLWWARLKSSPCPP